MNEEPTISPDVLGSAECIADPYPVYLALRSASPVRYLRLPANAVTGLAEPIYSYALLRHADVVAALRDPEAFSSDTPKVLKLIPRLGLLHDDPPHHTKLRRLVSKGFSAQRIAALAPMIEVIARELAEAMGRGPVELMQGFALPLPLRVIAGLLGVPGEEYPAFRRGIEAMLSYGEMPAEERKQKSQEFVAYLGRAVMTRRQEPKDDLLTSFIQAEVDGATLSDPEIVSLAILVLIAGHETTTNLLGNMLGILADRPELYERVRADRSLVEPIIEETLRFESSIHRLSRVTTRVVEMNGVWLEAGCLVDIFYGAANRDPAVFDEPETFSLGRANKDSVVFGHGIHFCLGAPLARLEAKIALNTLLDRTSTLKRGQAPAERQRVAPLSFGYRSLPLVLGASST